MNTPQLTKLKLVSKIMYVSLPTRLKTFIKIHQTFGMSTEKFHLLLSSGCTETGKNINANLSWIKKRESI